LLYDPVVGSLVNKAYTVRYLTEKELKNVDETIKAYTAITSTEPSDIVKTVTVLSGRHSMAELPPLGVAGSFLSRISTDMITAYAYFGIVCTTIQKNPGGTGWDAINTSRPAAYLRKYQWSSESVPFLGGDLAISKEAAIWMRREWMLIPQVRRTLFVYLAAISEADAPASDEVTFTVIRLMRWTDLNHVSLIYEFLTRFKIAASADVLVPYVEQFHRNVTHLIMSCPALLGPGGVVVKDSNGQIIRNTSAMPYVKILVSDKGDVVPRAPLEALIQVAHAYLSKTNDKLVGYVAPTKFGHVLTSVEEFERNVKARISEMEDEEVAPATVS
jgi:hypothetical protein